MTARPKTLRPNYAGIVGWLLLLLAFYLALFVVPYPHNGYALLSLALGGVGASLIIRALAGRTTTDE